MTDCATNRMHFDTRAALALEAAFDGGRLTSDGGLLWLAEMDEELGLCEVVSGCVPEWRKRKPTHSLASLVLGRGCCRSLAAMRTKTTLTPCE
jgi:hypothetical protein